MKLFAFYYNHNEHIPICIETRSEESFFRCCQSLPTDWAYLFNQDGFIIAQYPPKPAFLSEN